MNSIRNQRSDRRLTVLAVLLGILLGTALFFSHCGIMGPAGAESHSDPRAGIELQRFGDIEYVRPDLEKLRADIDAVKAALESGAKYSRVEALLDECYTELYNYYTMSTIAEIRSDLDLTDEYYAAEYDWTGRAGANVSAMFDELFYACGGSKLARMLERRYFWPGFAKEYSDPDASVYTGDYVSLLEKESGLVSQYRSLLTSPSVLYNNERLELYSALDEAESEGDYDKYYDILGAFYDQYNPRAAELYIELIRVRSAIAAELGYESVEQMQYESFFARDYSPADADACIAGIKQYILPLYLELRGSEEYKNISSEMLSEEKLMEYMDAVTAGLGGDIRKAFEFMTRWEMYDAGFSSNKANISYMTYIENYESPFLFLDARGDSSDILGFAHEFGHYAESYVNMNYDAAIDLSEVFSQGLEYLALSQLETVLDAGDFKALERYKIADTIDTYVLQAMLAEFESRVYALEPGELTAERINSINLELWREYGEDVAGNEEYYANNWIDVEHFFLYPFYVISYPVSCDAAMQIYELECGAHGAGYGAYLRLMDRRTTGLMETLNGAGLKSPFEHGRAQSTALILKNRFYA